MPDFVRPFILVALALFVIGIGMLFVRQVATLKTQVTMNSPQTVVTTTTEVATMEADKNILTLYPLIQWSGIENAIQTVFASEAGDETGKRPPKPVELKGKMIKSLKPSDPSITKNFKDYYNSLLVPLGWKEDRYIWPPDNVGYSVWGYKKDNKYIVFISETKFTNENWPPQCPCESSDTIFWNDDAISFRSQLIDTSTSSTSLTASWKTYRNDKYGFEVKYPELYVFEPDSLPIVSGGRVSVQYELSHFLPSDQKNEKAIGYFRPTDKSVNIPDCVIVSSIFDRPFTSSETYNFEKDMLEASRINSITFFMADNYGPNTAGYVYYIPHDKQTMVLDFIDCGEPKESNPLTYKDQILSTFKFTR